MKKTSLLSSFLIFLQFSASYAELADTQFSFSSLLSNSDVIAKGMVIAVSSEPDKYIINLEVQRYVKGGPPENPLRIIVPLAAGLRIPDEPYLEINGTYLLFLRQNQSDWTITNKIAGVLRAHQELDVSAVFQAFQANQDLFSTHQYSTALQEIFLSMAVDDSRTRLLYDLKDHLTSNDSPFISALLKSNNRNHKVFSILQCGRVQIESLRSDIESLLKNDRNYDVKFHAIVSLGDYGNPQSLNLIVGYLSDPDPSIRRAAVHAVGKIGGNEIVEPLRELYSSESDIGQRLAIIEAIVRAPDRSIVAHALEYFLSIETNGLLISILQREIAGF